MGLRVDTTNQSSDRFPDYSDFFVDESPVMTDSPQPRSVTRLQSDTESSRGASPQPSHISVPLPPHDNRNGHRILRSATVGYIAPEFVGKVEQMKSGKFLLVMITMLDFVANCSTNISKGNH